MNAAYTLFMMVIILHFKGSLRLIIVMGDSAIVHSESMKAGLPNLSHGDRPQKSSSSVTLG